MSTAPLVLVDRLRVRFGTPQKPVEVVRKIDLTLARGETVALVGESGSGKSMTALALLRLTEDKGATIAGGDIALEGQRLAGLDAEQLRKLRGKRIALVFQEPSTAFDPLFTIGEQIAEVIRQHEGASKAEARRRVVALLERVHLPDPALQVDRYPHELSGGMRQRAMIAMALACDPVLLIADEPTTALDVTIQAQILLLLRELQQSSGMALLLITHDLGVAAEMADRVLVMYGGRIVEEAPAAALFARPRHPYTRGLLDAVVPLDGPRGHRLPTIVGSVPAASAWPTGCAFHPRCAHASERCRQEDPELVADAGFRSVACFHPDPLAASLGLELGGEVAPSPRAPAAGLVLQPDVPLLVETIALRKEFRLGRKRLGSGRYVHAVDGVSLQIHQGRNFGLVGESGCGKTTLGRLLVELEKPTSGEILFRGQNLARLSGRDRREVRRSMQMVFQDFHGSLNPRWTAAALISEPLRIHTALRATERQRRAHERMELVGLDPRTLGRLPSAFSGGQKQRLAIARALALSPSFVVADEAVSGLDVSVQSQVINLLHEVSGRLGLTYLFIGHGLNVIRHIAEEVGVMYLGRLVERAPADEIFSKPAHHYTRALVASIPRTDPARRSELAPLMGELPSPSQPPRGCRFHPRCPAAQARCKEEAPAWRDLDATRSVACHFPA